MKKENPKGKVAPIGRKKPMPKGKGKKVPYFSK